MKLIVLAVFDVQVAAYQRPFFAPALGAGVRAVTDEVNRQGSEMNAHPKDYSLYKLGEFDDVTGRFFPEDQPALIVTALALKEQVK